MITSLRRMITCHWSARGVPGPAQGLSRWSDQRLPDEAALARLHATLDRVAAGDAE